MPKNLKAESCDAVVQTTLENMDWCAAAEENNCTLVSEENETEALSGDTARLQEPLSSIIANQEIIYKYIQDSFTDLNQSINMRLMINLHSILILIIKNMIYLY